MSLSGKLTIRSTDDEYVREIGRIDHVHLGVEDHGIFTFNMGVKFGAWHQGIGHLCLGNPSRDEWAVGGLKLLHDVMGVCGGDWSSIVGTSVLVLRESDRMHAPIIGIQALIGGEPIIFASYFQDWAASRDESTETGS